MGNYEFRMKTIFATASVFSAFDPQSLALRTSKTQASKRNLLSNLVPELVEGQIFKS
jgi:hypothetical protein